MYVLDPHSQLTNSTGYVKAFRMKLNPRIRRMQFLKPTDRISHLFIYFIFSSTFASSNHLAVAFLRREMFVCGQFLLMMMSLLCYLEDASKYLDERFNQGAVLLLTCIGYKETTTQYVPKTSRLNYIVSIILACNIYLATMLSLLQNN